MAKKDSNGFGIASLVLGISSIFFSLFFIGLLLGIIGIVLAVKQRNVSPNGVATAGLVTSIIGTGFSAIFVLVAFVGFMLFASLVSIS